MSATPINLTIYGANVDYRTTETPLISDITGLSGLTSVTVNCYTLGDNTILETDEQEYADGYKFSAVKFFGGWKVKILYRSYPTTATARATQYPELAVLKKPYLWIISTNYKVGFTVSNTCQAVQLYGWSETEFHNLKMIELELRNRKAD